MTSFKDENFKRQLVMKHYSKPVNKVDNLDLNWDNYYKHSEHCVDEINLALNWEDDKLIDSKFKAVGCAIFLSSTDLLLEKTKNKTTSEIKNILEHYLKLVNQEKDANEPLLEELVIFHNVKTHLNRLACASLTAELLLEKLK